MAKNMLKRKFSLRESIFMIVLVILLFLGLWLWLVYYPVNNTIADVEAQRAVVANDILDARRRESYYDTMKAELERIAALPAEEVTSMPSFPNLINLTAKFDRFDRELADWNITPSTATKTGNHYERPIRFVYTVAAEEIGECATPYEKAREILYYITHTGYRCLMSDLELRPDGKDILTGPVTVSCQITFYELAPA